MASYGIIVPAVGVVLLPPQGCRRAAVTLSVVNGGDPYSRHVPPRSAHLEDVAARDRRAAQRLRVALALRIELGVGGAEPLVVAQQRGGHRVEVNQLGLAMS